MIHLPSSERRCVLGLATRCRAPAKMLLLALAFAITTGSVVSPIGNPQNLLVAVNSGMNAPFVTFGTFLLNSPRHLSARNQQSQKFPQLHPRQRSDQCPDASPQRPAPTPLVPSSMPSTVSLPPKKPKNKKKIILVAGVTVIILIAVFAVAGILPMMGVIGSHNSSGSALTTTTTTAAVTTKSTNSTHTTVVRSPRQRLPFPDHG